jgi:hypothetical protein
LPAAFCCRFSAIPSRKTLSEALGYIALRNDVDKNRKIPIEPGESEMIITNVHNSKNSGENQRAAVERIKELDMDWLAERVSVNSH